MTTVIPISKTGVVTLPPGLRDKLGFGSGDDPLVLVEEQEGGILLRPASAAPVRDIPAQVIQNWIEEDEAGMREFESLPRPS